MTEKETDRDDKKTERVLFLWDRLSRGGSVSRQEMVETFGVNLRTASRYLAEIRKYLAEREEQDHVHRELYYDRARKVYRIRELEEEMIRPSELYAIGKILLASRAFHKKELESLLRRLLQSAVLGTDKKEVERYIRGELFDYLDPAHEKPDVENLWIAAGAVKKHHVLSFDYRRQGEKEASPHEICPEGVLFSEYYFYVVGIPKAEEKLAGADTIVYRLDRMSSLMDTGESFTVNYGRRFREGIFKNSIQYMYGGRPEHIRFLYRGPSLEAVLDRLPTAKAKAQKDGSFLITDVIRGDGILMWLLSQGKRVKMLSPTSLREKWLKEAEAICLENEEKE